MLGTGNTKVTNTENEYINKVQIITNAGKEIREQSNKSKVINCWPDDQTQPAECFLKKIGAIFKNQEILCKGSISNFSLKN